MRNHAAGGEVEDGLPIDPEEDGYIVGRHHFVAWLRRGWWQTSPSEALECVETGDADAKHHHLDELGRVAAAELHHIELLDDGELGRHDASLRSISTIECGARRDLEPEIADANGAPATIAGCDGPRSWLCSRCSPAVPAS